MSSNEISSSTKYRLITRSDFDGLVCAVLLKELNLIDEIKFVHPKDMQDGKVDVTSNDITTNLPYVDGVYLAFDHHLSEIIRNEDIYTKENHVFEAYAPSAARVVYDYYGGKEYFPNISAEMMAAVDKSDSAQFTLEDILHPQGWELLSFLMDGRTGLGRFRNFTISNYDLMMRLIDHCRSYSIDEILNLADVKERVDLYFEQEEKFKDQIKRCAKTYHNLIILDLRQEPVIYAGNRFMVYALFPDCNVSVHVLWGRQQKNTVFAAGKSIFNRTCNVFLGELMHSYGGGGHANAATCQVENDRAEEVLQALINCLQEN